MKKILNIFLLFILALSMISCGTTSLLKDSLEAGAGWGDVVLNSNAITIDPTLNITSSALNLDKAEVTIDKTKTTIGATVKNIKSGTKTISISVPSLDGKTIYSGTGSVQIQANVKSEANIILNTSKAATNAYKFILTEAKYNAVVKGDQAADINFADITKVTLAGGMNDWSNTSTLYSLAKDSDGTWKGYFPISEGTNFKFIVSTATKDNKWTKDNLTVQETTGLIESVLAWRFTLTEIKYNEVVKGDQAADINFADITKVTLAGGMNDWSNTSTLYSLAKDSDGTWKGYFPISEGTSFKFIVSTATKDNKWTKDNLTVQETTGLITQKF